MLSYDSPERLIICSFIRTVSEIRYKYNAFFSIDNAILVKNHSMILLINQKSQFTCRQHACICIKVMNIGHNIIS